jgi:hypothetical protein
MERKGINKIVLFFLFFSLVLFTSCGEDKTIIVEPTETPSISVVSPDGGEHWQVGNIEDITWITTGAISDVKIEYSTDSGTTWIVIVSDIQNDGSYFWTVPNAISSDCFVRVSEAFDGDPSDVSEDAFIIEGTPAPEVRVTYINPLGWVALTPNDFVSIGQITFTSDNGVDGILRSISYEAYYKDTLLSEFDPSFDYPVKFMDGLFLVIPPSPDSSSIFNIPLPLSDELNWMFTQPDSLLPVAVSLKLIFEGEDAYGQGQKFSNSFSSFSVTRF